MIPFDQWAFESKLQLPALTEYLPNILKITGNLYQKITLFSNIEQCRGVSTACNCT